MPAVASAALSILRSPGGTTDRHPAVLHEDDESLFRGITPRPGRAPNEGTQRAEVPVSTSNPAAAFMLACVAIVIVGYVRAMTKR
jgi:hypothetical protein